jgi:hypothetical protein
VTESSGKPRSLILFKMPALLSFTRVNGFLLLVYLKQRKCTSYILILSAYGPHIIRMYEARGGQEQSGHIVEECMRPELKRSKKAV